MLVAAPSDCSFCMPYAGRLRSADESVRYFAGEGSADIETAVGLRSTGYCRSLFPRGGEPYGEALRVASHKSHVHELTADQSRMFDTAIAHRQANPKGRCHSCRIATVICLFSVAYGRVYAIWKLCVASRPKGFVELRCHQPAALLYRRRRRGDARQRDVTGVRYSFKMRPSRAEASAAALSTPQRSDWSSLWHRGSSMDVVNRGVLERGGRRSTDIFGNKLKS